MSILNSPISPSNTSVINNYKEMKNKLFVINWFFLQFIA